MNQDRYFHCSATLAVTRLLPLFTRRGLQINASPPAARFNPPISPVTSPESLLDH